VLHEVYQNVSISAFITQNLSMALLRLVEGFPDLSCLDLEMTNNFKVIFL